MTNRIQHEACEQVKLFQWISFLKHQYPALDLLYHIPNGGSRNAIEAANLKRQGVRAGVPDLCLPVANKKYHGLYIELKYGKNKLTEKQKEWIAALSKQGYKAVVCYGWEDARTEICDYIGIPTSRKKDRVTNKINKL